jgi:hypothetical protein
MTAPAVVVLTCSLDELRALVRAEVDAALAERAAAPSTAPLRDKGELARALDVSPATITRLTGEGMPHVFVGASPRYALDEVCAWLAARGRQGTIAKQPRRDTIAGVTLLSRRAR